MLTTAEKLDLINKKVCACEKCPALVESRTNTVFGDGNPKAKVVFLGEGPGADEDKQGVPFVGRAGQLLNNILSACDLDRQEDAYILNIVKCRPPGNRNPTPVEANNCRSFLDLQLRTIRPRFIVAMGSVAAQNLLGVKVGITALRRQNWHEIEEPISAKVLCTFHPAYLLRNPPAKEDVWEDMQKLLHELRDAD